MTRKVGPIPKPSKEIPPKVKCVAIAILGAFISKRTEFFGKTERNLEEMAKMIEKSWHYWIPEAESAIAACEASADALNPVIDK